MSIHFVALFSEKEDAVPIVLLHGWPGNAVSVSANESSLMSVFTSNRKLPGISPSSATVPG